MAEHDEVDEPVATRGRYEVSIDSPLELRKYPKFGGIRRLIELTKSREPVSVWFQDRRFTWHPGTEESRVIITVPIKDSENYNAERFAMERFLSALSFKFGYGLTVAEEAASGFKKEFDPPLLQHPHLPGTIFPAPVALSVPDDEDLTLCLAHMREGMAATSVGFRFLSFWKAVEVAVGSAQFVGWVGGAAARGWPAEGLDADGWFARLNDGRNAAAHAVRFDPESLHYHPDDPLSRVKIRTDVDKLWQLARQAIDERWPDPVKEMNSPD
jgi:hypothetical protein